MKDQMGIKLRRQSAKKRCIGEEKILQHSKVGARTELVVCRRKNDCQRGRDDACQNLQTEQGAPRTLGRDSMVRPHEEIGAKVKRYSSPNTGEKAMDDLPNRQNQS